MKQRRRWENFAGGSGGAVAVRDEVVKDNSWTPLDRSGGEACRFFARWNHETGGLSSCQRCVGNLAPRTVGGSATHRFPYQSNCLPSSPRSGGAGGKRPGGYSFQCVRQTPRRAARCQRWWGEAAAVSALRGEAAAGRTIKKCKDDAFHASTTPRINSFVFRSKRDRRQALAMRMNARCLSCRQPGSYRQLRHITPRGFANQNRKLQVTAGLP